MMMTEQEQQKVFNALALIEEAQRQILTAAQELSSVNGMAREWSDVCKLYDQVKSKWHKVEARRQQLQRRAAKVA